jgi:hypothetical protein
MKSRLRISRDATSCRMAADRSVVFASAERSRNGITMRIAASASREHQRGRAEIKADRWQIRAVRTGSRGGRPSSPPGARVWARNKGLEFDLDASFLIELDTKQSGRCFWLGVPLQPSAEARNPLQPSVDRLDPSRGYTRDNVVLACQFANMGRSAMSADRFREFIASLAVHFASGAAHTTA